jgi:polyprenyl-phospho-N-acetylgalactosaminyl synthase
MTQNLNKIFIIIPALNEEDHIGAVLDKFKSSSYQVVVVDDGSIDKTASIVRQYSGVYLVQHCINRGMGAALQTGNDFALKSGADIIVHFDADGQMQIEDIKYMIQPLLDDDADITMGSRFLGKVSNIPWFKRFVIQPPAKIINYFFTGVWLTDVHNGFRAITADTARKITIKQDHMAHATEITASVKKNKLRYKEIPVKIIYFEFGQNLLGGFKILFDLVIKKF